MSYKLTTRPVGIACRRSAVDAKKKSETDANTDPNYMVSQSRSAGMQIVLAALNRTKSDFLGEIVNFHGQKKGTGKASQL